MLFSDVFKFSSSLIDFTFVCELLRLVFRHLISFSFYYYFLSFFHTLSKNVTAWLESRYHLLMDTQFDKLLPRTESKCCQKETRLGLVIIIIIKKS